MYTDTTSFYAGTAVDNTTWCRGDDDIVVVEFDGDEDESGIIPQRHIPARFCTLIGWEDPLSKTVKKRVRNDKSKKSSNKRKSG
jgi:hypothetical protein